MKLTPEDRTNIELKNCSSAQTKQESRRRYPILAVEDNPVSRLLLQSILQKFGHEVTFVNNGKEAIELFRKRFFPIILSDWVMPEMDGLELCRAVRSASTPGYVFIIILTSRNEKEDIVAGLEAGADDYLAKPFNPGELSARINTGIRILELERSLKEANEQIRKLSNTDPLTGVANRGFFDKRLPMEIKRALRYERPLSVVMCDIDHFKRVNDTYGHQAGDHVLKEFASFIDKSIRKNVDWLARYGGEEFVVVLPETDQQGALVVAERLRKEISFRTIQFESIELRVTSSFGIASLKHTASDANVLADLIKPDLIKPDLIKPDLIKQADRMLYLAKEKGRNRVEA